MELLRPARSERSQLVTRPDDSDCQDIASSSLAKKLLGLVAPTHNPGSSKVAVSPSFPPAQSRRSLPSHEERSKLADSCTENQPLPGLTQCELDPAKGDDTCASASDNTSKRSSSTTSTIATSPPLSIQQQVVLQVDKDLFIAPDIRMNDDRVHEFKKVCSLLDDTLKHTFYPKVKHDTALSYELMMAGPSPYRFKPCVLVVCCDETQKKQLKKIIKGLKWTKDYSFFWRIIVDPVQKFARETGREMEALPRRCEREQPRPVPDQKLGRDGDESQRLAGQARITVTASVVDGGLIGAVATSRQPHSMARAAFTIGGVVLIGETPFAMTTGHSLKTQKRIIRVNLVDDDPIEEVADDSDSDSESPFDFSDDSTVRSINPENVVAISALDSVQNEQQTSSCEKTLLLGSSCILSPNDSLIDWALIQLNDEAVHQWSSNTIIDSVHDFRMEIKSVIGPSDSCQGEVWIKGGVTGLVKGTFHHSSSYLHLGGHTIEVCQIMPDKPMAPGDSGSWVVQNGRLCGHIIAGRQRTPWVYMIRADKTFDDMASCVGVKQVCLPETYQEKTHVDKTGAGAARSASPLQPDCSQVWPGAALAPPSIVPLSQAHWPPPVTLQTSDDENLNPRKSVSGIDRAQNTPETLAQRDAAQLLRVLDNHHAQYLSTLRTLYENLSTNHVINENHETANLVGRPSSSSEVRAALGHQAEFLKSRSIVASGAPLPQDSVTRKLVSLGGPSLRQDILSNAEDSEEDSLFIPLLPASSENRVNSADYTVLIKSSLPHHRYRLDELLSHIRFLTPPAMTTVVLGYIWDLRDDLKPSDIFDVSDMIPPYQHTPFQVCDFAGNGSLVEQYYGLSETSINDLGGLKRLWNCLMTFGNHDGAVAGRSILLSQPSPPVLAIAHLGLSLYFDMDEVYQFLGTAGMTQHCMRRAMSESSLRQRSFLFIFKYYTLIEEGLSPLPWQRVATSKRDDKWTHGLDIAECTSILGLSLVGPPTREIQGRTRDGVNDHGQLFDPFSPWYLLNIRCIPDDGPTKRRRWWEMASPVLNGPLAFVNALTAEYGEAVTRLTSLADAIKRLITPPSIPKLQSELLFDFKLRDRLLFESKDLSYIRRYLWAYETLGILNDNIDAMVKAYEDAFTEDFWLGRETILWSLESPDDPQYAEYLRKLSAARLDLERSIDDLQALQQQNERTRQKVRDLREHIFTGSSVAESRRVITQSDNIRVMTILAVLYLPLVFVTTFYGVTEHAIPYDTRLAVALGSGGVILLMLVVLLQTQAWSAMINKPIAYMHTLFRTHGRNARANEERNRAESSGSRKWWEKGIPQRLKGRRMVQENGKREGPLSYDPGMVC